MQIIKGLDCESLEQNCKFPSLFHLINEENFKICFKNIKAGREAGIDSITKFEYSQNLGENIQALVQKLQNKIYKPKPVKRVFISKDENKNNLRMLGIVSIEDKIIQKCIQEILMLVYKPIFMECAYGLGPGKSCHNAIHTLNKCIMKRPINYIVEVDIRKFFDNIQHRYLIYFLNKKILDQNLLQVIYGFLKAGAIEKGEFCHSEVGTPQGGVISSVLANVYLHYVIDVWFENVIKRKRNGYMKIIRYCDDFIVCCEKEKDAKNFLQSVKVRLNKFGLSIAEEKTRIINFGKKQWSFFEKYNISIKEFDFLGFTHYAKKNHHGKWTIIQKTSIKNFSRKLSEINDFIRKNRNIIPLNELWESLKSKLRGHINYFGIKGNIKYVKHFIKRIVLILFKWINKRKSKRKITWRKYMQYMKFNPLPKIVLININAKNNFVRLY